jgi:poly(U)-binding-splicing factor PUF60
MDAVQANVLGVTAPTLKSLSSPTSNAVSTLSQASTISSPGSLPSAVLQQTHSSITTASADSQIPHVTSEELVKQKQEELQKKLMEEGEPTLQQQESMSIKGQNARHLVMQRLMRPRDSKVVILRNMVGPEDVDETLQEEIQEECSKFGSVERVVIYKEKQTDNDDDDFDDVLVKIFVEFSVSGGKLCNKLLFITSVS